MTGYPERDIGAEEEEGQGWGDSRRLIGHSNKRIKTLLSQEYVLSINSAVEISMFWQKIYNLF